MRDSYQHFNCGSFPSTIGAQKSKYFTFLNFKANFDDRFKIVKSFGQIVDFYDVFFIPHFANSIKASSILAWVTSTVTDRKSTRLNSSHVAISYAVFCLKKKRLQ